MELQSNQLRATGRHARPSQFRHVVALLIVGLIVQSGIMAAANSAGAATRPSAPTNVTAQAVQDGLYLTWKPPEDDGGSSVIRYVIKYKTVDVTSWKRVRTGGDKNSHSFVDLRAGSTYEFKVRAVTAAGRSPWSVVSEPVTFVVVEPAPGDGWWRPALGTDWQWQLSGRVDLGVESAVFDIDGEDASAGLVRSLHDKGARVICYIDVGAWENYRGDADGFPESVKGKTVGGWPDERWLDIRQLDVLLPIMERRIRDCVAKGFDGLEPDLMDGFSNRTGFPLTYEDQILYNKEIARLAHKHGLGVALKNDPEQVADLERFFDFAVVEECVRYEECGEYLPFTRNGKAVLHVEYQGSRSEFCGVTKPLHFSSMKKRYSLDRWRSVCP